jgi:DNA mismatch repair protein PMS2
MVKCAFVAGFSGVITKDDFLRMEIIGQFNLGACLVLCAPETADRSLCVRLIGCCHAGFIIVRLGAHHVFIIDQHAADEKYRFELLQASLG